uniref:Thiamine pyrophosphokinase n=1 Tax=Tetraselmis sp. GSL018 TaxID=582737 RepID=A0A061S914_9CHLO
MDNLNMLQRVTFSFRTCLFSEPYELSNGTITEVTGEPLQKECTDCCEETVFLVVLNWWLPKCSPYVWERATYRVVADGGANRLYREIPKLIPELSVEEVRSRFVPDCVVGDLDSLKPEVRAFYESKGVAIHDKSEDQDTNDLTKCIHACLGYMEESGLRRESVTIVCVGALGGRLDHTLGNLNVLYSFQELNLVLCGDGNLTRLLPAGTSVIHPDRAMEGPTCGLIPLGGPVRATTTGLRWNLDNTEMRFAGLVSTSNMIDADEIVVHSDGPLLWTTKLRDRVCPLCGAVGRT